MGPIITVLGYLRAMQVSSQEVFYASVGLLVLAFVLLIVQGRKNAKLQRERMEALMSGTQALSADEFLRYTNPSAGEVTGVYILHNITRDMYYVGQSKRVFTRVRHHLTGSGNGDVYADYRRGDAFEVTVLSCARSGYESINALERELIAHTGAFTHGYNKTAGNRG